MTHPLASNQVVEGLREALAMPWGGDRNLAVRAVLEQVAPDLHVGFVDDHGQIQTRMRDSGSAARVAGVLRQVKPWVGSFQRSDGDWVVYAQDGQG